MNLEYVAEESKTVKTDSGKILCLEYDAYAEPMVICDEETVCYGIEVRERDGEHVHSRRFSGITCHLSEIRTIFRLVTDGLVFPDELEEILEQIIEEKIL